MEEILQSVIDKPKLSDKNNKSNQETDAAVGKRHHVVLVHKEIAMHAVEVAKIRYLLLSVPYFER